VLASASPRRRELLPVLGLPWRAEAQAVDEAAHLYGDASVAALNVAVAKCRAVAARLDDDEVGLGADTAVVHQGRVLGKPADAQEARAMLLELRDRAHEVATGVALLRPDGLAWGAVVTSRVWMRAYAEAEIDAYVARGGPFDKAGGYAIQDRGFRPVARFDGCYLNVVGLPLCAVARGLETLACPPARAAPSMVPPCGYCRAGRALLE
jgi:septum formation protein